MATRSTRVWMAAAVIAAACAFVAFRGCGDETTTTTGTRTAAASVAPRHATQRRAAAPLESSGDAPDAKGAVVVRVLAAEDDSPIAAASVALADTAEDVARRVTDADGVARFASLEASTRKFSASSPGRVTRFGECTVDAGSESTLVLRLSAAILLQVRVEDRRTGAPIADAKIDVDVVGDDAEDRATTGDDGERLLLEPADLILRVSASADGFDEASATVRTGARGGPSIPVVLRLSPLWRLTGVVRGPDGVAVPGAFVVVAPAAAPLRPNDPEQPWSRLETYRAVETTANQNGEFAAAGLVPGRRYHAFARGASSQWAPSAVVEDIVVTSDAVERAQDFVLSQYGRLVVHVTGEDDKASTNVTVSFVNGVRALRCSERGTFVGGAFPPGLVTVLCSGVGVVARDVVIPAGGTAETTLDAQAIPIVRGVVVDDMGNPVSGAEVRTADHVRTVNALLQFGSPPTDSHGGFVAATGKMGTCSLTATAPGHRASGRVDVQSPADDVRIVLRRAATVMFRPGPEDVIAPGRITFLTFDVAIDGGFDAGKFTAFSSRDPADGAVRVECEPIGDTRVGIYSAGLAPVVRRATLTAGAVADLGEIRSARPRTIEVHVVDAGGRAVASASVEADDGEWHPSGYRPPVTDADGNAMFPSAPPAGPLPLRVRAAGFLELRTVVDVEGDAPVTVTLARGGLLWGEVVDAGGLPSPDAEVHVADARGTEVAQVTADRHGQFDVRVAPGRYLVRADSGPGVSVELTEGEDEHVQPVTQTR